MAKKLLVGASLFQLGIIVAAHEHGVEDASPLFGEVIADNGDWLMLRVFNGSGQLVRTRISLKNYRVEEINIRWSGLQGLIFAEAVSYLHASFLELGKPFVGDQDWVRRLLMRIVVPFEYPADVPVWAWEMLGWVTVQETYLQMLKQRNDAIICVYAFLEEQHLAEQVVELHYIGHYERKDNVKLFLERFTDRELLRKFCVQNRHLLLEEEAGEREPYRKLVKERLEALGCSDAESIWQEIVDAATEKG